MFYLKVDALKAQLAIQEVELAKKNAEADHLIHVVGVETENVTQQKKASMAIEQYGCNKVFSGSYAFFLFLVFSLLMSFLRCVGGRRREGESGPNKRGGLHQAEGLRR